jgi:hypothetical protein
MVIIGAELNDIRRALDKVNETFGGNVAFNRFPESMGFTRDGRPKFRLTLRVESSQGPGARFSHQGRRMAAACWHVHGNFFRALPASCTIKAGPSTVTPASPWYDFNIGSMAVPLMYSEACGCGGLDAMPRGVSYGRTCRG